MKPLEKPPEAEAADHVARELLPLVEDDEHCLEVDEHGTILVDRTLDSAKRAPVRA